MAGFDVSLGGDVPGTDTDALLASGVDVVAISRIESLLDRFGESFLDRVYAPEEVEYCSGRAVPAQHYAARWAAKEAAIKALPDGGPTVTPASVVVVSSGGPPRLALRGPARTAVERLAARADLAVDDISPTVSLSHDRTADVAVAHAVVGAVADGSATRRDGGRP